MTLTSSDIINKSRDAVDTTNLKQVQELARVAWSEAYMDKISDTTVNIEQRVIEALEKENIDLDLYYIQITTKGAKVSKRQPAWNLQKTLDSSSGKVASLKVTNGMQSLNVGTVVNYMPDGVGPTTYKGGWKILGADEQGRLLLLSNGSITGETISLDGIDDCKSALTLLQNTVDDYKDGVIGIQVRSINRDDIDKLDVYGSLNFRKRVWP